MSTKTIGAEMRDQALHFAAAIVALAPFALLPGPIGGALSGVILGLIRETAQHDTFKVWTLGSGSYRDVTFWASGGAAAGMLAQVL